MPPAEVRTNDMVVGVEGARPYGIAGNMPADVVATSYKMHGSSDAVQYVSDAPYIAPSYKERARCIGTRKDGEPCKAKQSPGKLHCAAHQPQE